MQNRVRNIFGLVIMLLLASGIPAMAQQTSAALTVPVKGSQGFSGTATINGFVNQGGQIVAVGFVANSTHTAFAGVAWKVNLSADTTAAKAAYSGATPAAAPLTEIAWSPDRQNGARLVPVQSSTTCGVLTINLGATSVNLAGATVSLPAITLNITGDSSTPVGGLVCSLLNAVSAVGGAVNTVVGLLNTLLSTLSGLTGSLTGAVGGAAGGTGGLLGGL